eukprot:m.102767 g.102767  ORF g.102767 m.102767 type:complete len:842 (-) comp27434_c0_seq1:392-2917(-)
MMGMVFISCLVMVTLGGRLPSHVDIDRDIDIAANQSQLHASSYTEIVPRRWVVKAPSTAPDGVERSNSGQPIPPSWPQLPVTVSALRQTVYTKDGVLVLASNALFYLRAVDQNVSEFVTVDVTGAATSSETQGGTFALPADGLIATTEGEVVALVTSENIMGLVCTLDKHVPTCVLDKTFKLPWTEAILNDVTVATAPSPVIWVASSKGLAIFHFVSQKVTPVLTSCQVQAVAWSELRPDVVAAGGDEKLWIISAASTNPRVIRWEWVTNVPQGWGGAVDNNITALVWGMADNAPTASVELYIGTASCLNVMHENSTISRIADEQGLPISGITALAKTTQQLWVGTRHGVALRDSTTSTTTWKYLAGPRWLAGDSIKSLAVLPQAMSTQLSTGRSIMALAENGTTLLQQQAWTLERKAAVFEEILTARHDRHGLTSEADLASYGSLKNSTSRDNDNNGLWSSLVVAAEYFRYAVTGDPEALATGSKYFAGLVLLNTITDKKGLMARSCCAPDEIKAGTCMDGSWIHDHETWWNSTAAGYEGWTWKGDTSSDESTGHVFGLSVVAKLSPIASEREKATSLLNDIVSGIANHDYALIGHSGNATTWGRWGPYYVNEYRPFSDERGVQSLQMLSYLAAAANATAEAGTNADLWKEAYATLTNNTNQYDKNTLNTRIKSPCDENYSDDELTFLPFFTYLFMCPANSTCAFDRAPISAALKQAFVAVRPGRSALWGAIYLSMLSERDTQIVNDINWNLQTWPLELIQWPVSNRFRQDLLFQPGADRFQHTHTQTSKLRSPIPANERSQYRWNANPFDVTDGGTGMQEGDPGAWLLPYWMSRYYNLI